MTTPGDPRPNPARRIVAAAAIIALLSLAACGRGREAQPLPGPTIVRPAPVGDPRTTMLGFSSLPPERTAAAYAGAFGTAAQYADIVLIQRTPPWEDFLPGAQISKSVSETTVQETALLKQYAGLSLFYAIDPTDGVVQRSRIANLPAGIDPQVGFLDPRLRNAFNAYTTYVVKNYHPAFLAIGVEVNMLLERSPRQFEAFVSLYREAYTHAKAADARTKVFPTFQLEDLEGKLDNIHPPRWEVLDSFRGYMDALAISSYPFLGDVRSAADIRPDYYSQLRRHWEGDIIIAETGYASAPVEGEMNIGTEEDQLAFLQRLLADAEESRFTAVVWLAALDPAFATQGAAVVFKDVGLRRSDGANKLAWSTWEEWSRRPLRRRD